MPTPATEKTTSLAKHTGIDYGTEDELSAPLKPSRITPRVSLAGGPSPAAPNATPYADLRQLAAIAQRPSTPRRSVSGAGLSFPRRHVATNTPNTSRVRRPLAERSNPSTPHTLRAFQHLRATPGQERRKSGRLQRETPRDALRNLSKVLAPVSQVIRSSPQPQHHGSSIREQTAHDGLGEGLDLLQPRFSIAIDDKGSGDDSLAGSPPQLSMPIDGEPTGRSIEVARHVTSERGKSRHSRGSFASLGPCDRLSDVSVSDLIDPSTVLRYDGDAQQPLDVDADRLENVGLRLDADGDTKGLIFESSDRPSDPINDLGSAQNALENGTHSPFTLVIPFSELGEASLQSSPYQSVSPSAHQPADREATRPDTEVSETYNCRITKTGATKKPQHTATKKPKTSRGGVLSLLPGVTKSIATSSLRKFGMKQSRISKETLDAIIEAGDLYFRQLGKDLSAFTKHAGRKKVDETDVIAIMKRQRHLSATATPFSLAQESLPAELLRDIRLPFVKVGCQSRKRGLDDEDEDLAA